MIRVKRALKFIILVGNIAGCSAIFAATFTGKVVGVSDGDTITLLDQNKTQYKVRLIGIDAPEKKQAFGNRSKQHLSDLVFGKNVIVEWQKTDRYGRILGKIIDNGKDANLAQIRAGYAWHYKRYQSDQSPSDRNTYSEAEITAKAEQAGLWRDAFHVPPWEFRRAARESATLNTSD